MPSYTAQTTISLEHESPFDTHTVAFSAGARFAARATHEGVTVVLDIDGTDGTATLTGIDAATEDAAFDRACLLLARAASVATLEIALANPNPHHGHMRVAWRPGSVTITPRGGWADSLRVQSLVTVAEEQFALRFSRAVANPMLGTLLSSVARAMGNDDFRSKFYNAFTVLEYVEATYTAALRCSPLVPNDKLEALLEAMNTVLVGPARTPDDRQLAGRVRERLRGTLVGATLETRAEKLHQLLTEVFQIRTIRSTAGELELDTALVKDFIEIRNRIFHAGQDESEPPLATEHVISTTTLLLQTVSRVAAAIADRAAG